MARVVFDAMCNTPTFKQQTTFHFSNRAGNVSGSCEHAGTRNSIENRTQTHGKLNTLIFPHIIYRLLRVDLGNDLIQRFNVLGFEGNEST
jgi:hypothetical protein